MRDSEIDSAYDAVTEEMGKAPGAELWALAIKQRYVVEYIAGEQTLDELVNYLEASSDIMEKLSQVRKERQKSPGKSDTVSYRRQAIEEIFNIEAAQLDAVTHFREEWLGSSLLELDQVPEWVVTRQEIEGPASAWLKVLMDDDGNPVDRTDIQHGYETSFHVLKFVAPSEAGVQAVHTVAGGALFQLSELAETLHRRYDWSSAWAATFVLTGHPPPVLVARATANAPWPWYGARRRITISVRVDTKPTTVMDIYRRERKRLLGDQPFPRAISEHNAKLGVFAAAHSDGYTWAEAMRIWNRQHPDEQFESEAQFTRDGRDAFQRIMGEPLSWTGAGRTERDLHGTN